MSRLPDGASGPSYEELRTLDGALRAARRPSKERLASSDGGAYLPVPARRPSKEPISAVRKPSKEAVGERRPENGHAFSQVPAQMEASGAPRVVRRRPLVNAASASSVGPVDSQLRRNRTWNDAGDPQDVDAAASAGATPPVSSFAAASAGRGRASGLARHSSLPTLESCDEPFEPGVSYKMTRRERDILCYRARRPESWRPVHQDKSYNEGLKRVDKEKDYKKALAALSGK